MGAKEGEARPLQTQTPKGGPRLLHVQLRWETKLTCADYLKQAAWEDVELAECPFHPRGGCGMRRHGTYGRQQPQVFRVPRWYCRRAGRTISLLPDFAAAQVPGTLKQVEAAVEFFEQARRAGATVQQAAQQVRPDIEGPGARRWVARRCAWVRAAFVMLAACCPEILRQCELSIRAVRAQWGVPCIMVAVREVAALQVQAVAHPVGFRRASSMRNCKPAGLQQPTGPDPPSRAAAK